MTFLLTTISSTSNEESHVTYDVGKKVKFHSLNGVVFFSHMPD